MNMILNTKGENMSLKTNELKKGTWVLLRNGWKAELLDNMRGNTRVANVYGDFTVAGSVYSHDIMKWGSGPGQIIWPVEHTPAQLKLKAKVEELFND
jgi:hypothetical protein